jgi:hypothetical protein
MSLVTFGIQDCKVAPRDGVDDYGTAVDVPFIQMMNITMRVISAEGTGDDRIVAVASRVIAGQGQCRMQGVPLAALAVITGMTLASEGTTPDEIDTLPIVAGTRLPAFGIVGQGLAEEGLGDLTLFVPNAKITSDVTLGTMEYGQLSQVEFTFTAIDDGEYDILNLIEHETALTALAIPPAHLDD